jgi:acetyl esterase/lipase
VSGTPLDLCGFRRHARGEGRLHTVPVVGQTLPRPGALDAARLSPADLLNLWRPIGAWEEHHGLAYGEGPRQTLDVYQPRHATKAPVVVFFYGGSWQGGSRDLYPFVGASLAAQGIVTIVPDYSIFPPARFPTFIKDAARAVRFAGKSATQWGGDPSRLVLMGHSAGAYIAAMLSFDPQWLGEVDIESQTDLAGFIGLAGPYDFTPIQNRTLRTIFGGANRVETQPISFVTGKEVPSLLITARRDPLVSPGNSRRMAAKIRDHGGVAEVLTYGGVGHLTLIGAFAPALQILAPVLREVTQFVWRVTRQADLSTLERRGYRAGQHRDYGYTKHRGRIA